MPSSDDEWSPTKENCPHMQRRRKSVVPKGASVPHPVDPISHCHEYEENHPPLQRRRKSVVPKATSTLHPGDPSLKRCELNDNHPPLQRRKSVLKHASALHPVNPILQYETEEKHPPLQRREKSVLPKATSTLHPEDPILKYHELGDNCSSLKRRKSVVSKAASTLQPVDPNLQNPETVENLPPMQRRKKSVVPKATSTLHPEDPILKQHEFEDNYPPLQRRKSIVPKAALKLCPNDPILKQRQEFESELCTYSGDDPLSVWCKYIKWVEQNFIKGGKDGPIEHLMKQCLETLQNNKRYFNDNRFIEIWLKFAAMSKNPTQVYNYMYKQNIGCASASFYIAWSSKLEEEGNMIKANEVLKKGIHCKSEPVNKIKHYWSEFKARAGSKVMADSEQNTDELKDHHSKYWQSAIQSEKNYLGIDGMQTLPNMRVSFSNGHVINPVSSKKTSSSISLGGGIRHSCFVDPRLSIMSRVSSVVEVHQDCENPPVALFEPPDPMKLPMYNKNKVYAGIQEISLEEILADAWFKREKTLNNEKRIAEQDQLLAEQMEKIKTLQLEIEKLKAEHLKVESKQSVTAPFFQTSSEIETETNALVSISQVQNPSASESCKSDDNHDPASHKTTTDNKTQSRKTVKNWDAIERELSPILEHNEENYRSSGSSTSTIPFFHESKNAHEHIDNEDNTLKGSQLLNQSTTFSKSVIDETIKDSNSLSVKDTFKILSTTVDPFDKKVNENLLKSLNLPPDYYGNMKKSKKFIDSFEKKDLIEVGDVMYVIENLIGKGSYGKVYVATKQHPDSNTLKSKVALKVCKNASNWEIYICMTLHHRLERIKHLPDIHSSVMKITSAHRYSDAIIFTNEFSQRGTLLDLVYVYKSKKSNVPELLAMYITLEMLQVMSKMHECHIVHADVKPDNVLIRDNISKCDVYNSLSQKTILTKFIDFGRAIDLTLFKKGTCFKTTFKKDDQCIEMREKKPWVFQLDWYGLLNCIHVLLFSTYIQIRKQADGKWCIRNKFRRYWDQTIWIPLFDELLNIPSCYQEPNLEPHISRIESKLKQNEEDFKL